MGKFFSTVDHGSGSSVNVSIFKSNLLEHLKLKFAMIPAQNTQNLIRYNI